MPFTDAEVLKDCMVSMLEELVTDKSMDGVIAVIKQAPQSVRSVQCCVMHLRWQMMCIM